MLLPHHLPRGCATSDQTGKTSRNWSGGGGLSVWIKWFKGVLCLVL
jgi:hypothetical protein